MSCGRLSGVESEVQTASDSSKKAASVASQVVSEIVTVSDDHSLSARHVRSPLPSDSVQTAADSTARDSPLSSVHTSPSLHHSANAGSQSASESVRTAVDSTVRDSPLSSVHTSPSLQPQQPAVKLQELPGVNDEGLLIACLIG